MTEALNYTAKAIAALRSHPCPGAPLSRASNLWVADLLERAAVFILPDCGQLLDRSRPNPEVPGLTFKPPFPVVACEYPALNGRRDDGPYNAVQCSRRIALAWDWTGDMPSPLKAVPGLASIKPGVAVLSVFYVDKVQTWTCNGGALHLPYDGQWLDPRDVRPSTFRQSMIASGAITAASAKARGLESSFIPLMIEHLDMARSLLGSLDAALDVARADGNDEVSAYTDLCYALACRNVSTQRHEASAKLNRARVRNGQVPLPDHHTLTINGEEYASGGFGVTGDRSGPRSHLRRGHIRRLGADRITWVNQTMVGGKGFVSKDYRMKAAVR